MYHFCKEDYEILAVRAGQKGTVVGTKFIVNEYFVWVMRFLFQKVGLKWYWLSCIMSAYVWFWCEYC
jgi:hypothetical protein